MKRAVCTLIRLIASALLLFGLLEFGLEYLRHRSAQHPPINWWHCVLGAVLVVFGIILFMGSASLADQLTDDFEE